MAAFVNPHVVRFTFNDNFARNTFKRTFIELVKENGKKLSEIALQNAVTNVETMEQLSKSLSLSLVKLNISGCALNLNSCRILNLFLLRQDKIKELNISKCKLAH